MKIKDIIEEYGISVGAYYHWSNRYARDGILGLMNKKAGAGVPYNKTPEDSETKIVEIASTCVRLSNPWFHQPLPFDIWITSLIKKNII